MTNDEFKRHWHKKHKTVFAHVNRVLKEHGFTGKLKTLSMTVPKTVAATMPEASADDCCGNCKHPPCADDEVETVCVCPDGSGGSIIKRCCVKVG